MSQRIKVQRVEFIRGENTGKRERALQRQSPVYSRDIRCRRIAWDSDTNLIPQIGQQASRAFTAVDSQPVGKGHSIDSPAAGCTDPFDRQAFIFEQPIQDSPGKRAVCSTALQRQIDDLPFS